MVQFTFLIHNYKTSLLLDSQINNNQSWTLCVVSDNFFRVVSLNLFIISSWTNLINSNVIYNHIFIYYRDNHKCNIYIYIYIYICGGGFCSWPPVSLYVRFGEPSPHGFVLKQHRKTLSAVPHRQIGRASCRERV